MSGAAPGSASTRSASACAAALRHQIAAQIVRLGDGRREADGRKLRRDGEQPREPERQQIAALRHHQRMQLVEDHALERAEQERRIVGGEQQRELLGRGEQDVGRIAALALALRDRRVAGARLEADRQSHLGDRTFEIARDVDRERLERRDVEGVQAAGAADAAAGGDEFLARRRFCRRQAGTQLHQRRQKSRQRLAGAGRRDQQRGAAGAREPQQFELMRARRPAA